MSFWNELLCELPALEIHRIQGYWQPRMPKIDTKYIMNRKHWSLVKQKGCFRFYEQVIQSVKNRDKFVIQNDDLLNLNSYFKILHACAYSFTKLYSQTCKHLHLTGQELYKCDLNFTNAILSTHVQSTSTSSNNFTRITGLPGRLSNSSHNCRVA